LRSRATEANVRSGITVPLNASLDLLRQFMQQ